MPTALPKVDPIPNSSLGEYGSLMELAFCPADWNMSNQRTPAIGTKSAANPSACIWLGSHVRLGKQDSPL
jgi:hypothetical protein